MFRLLIEGIGDKEKAYMVDATLGMAGHSIAALERFPLPAHNRWYRDLQAIEIAKKRTQKYSDRITFVHTTYDNINKVVQKYCPNAKRTQF